MSDYRAASRYAKSLIALAGEQNALEEVHHDMLMFDSLCRENHDFVLMLKNPIIKHDKKRSILKKIFEGKVNKLTMAILDIITRKNREGIMPAIAKEFHHEYNILKGVQVAKVTTAIPLTDSLRSQFKDMVKTIAPTEQVDLMETVDETVIGGYVLKVGDRQLDETLRSKLKALELEFSKNPYIKEF